MYLKLDSLDYFQSDVKEELDRRMPSVERYDDLELTFVIPKELEFDEGIISAKIRKLAEKRAEIFQFEYVLVRKQGYKNFLKGFLLLIIFFSLAYLLNGTGSRFLSLVSETLTIAVWVAFWKPMDTFLFELPKLKLMFINYRKLISAKINFEEKIDEEKN